MWSRDCRSQSQLTWRSEAQETASCSVHQVENREATELSSMMPTWRHHHHHHHGVVWVTAKAAELEMPSRVLMETQGRPGTRCRASTSSMVSPNPRLNIPCRGRDKVKVSSGHPHLLPHPGQEPGAGVGVEPRQVAVEGPEQLRGGAEQDGEGERGLAAQPVAQLAAHRAARTQAEDVQHLHRAHGRLLQARRMREVYLLCCRNINAKCVLTFPQTASHSVTSVSLNSKSLYANSAPGAQDTAAEVSKASRLQRAEVVLRARGR